MTSRPDTLTAFIDAAADAVAKAIATVHREAQREREVREAQFVAKMAELETRLAAVSEVERRLADRLATLKDGADGRDGVDGQDGRDGIDATAPTADEIAALIIDDAKAVASEVARSVVEAWELPKDGTSVTIDDVEPILRKMVEALPPAKDGADGKDADPAEVVRLVNEAVARIPAPRDGQDGKDGENGKDGEKGDPGASVESIDIDLIDDGATAVFRFTVGGLESAFEVPLPRGLDGKDGERGPEGPPGSLPPVKAWEDGVYYKGAVVAFDGSSYQANKDTGKAPPHADWTCIVSRGAAGCDGKSFTVCGTHSEDNEYEALDVVALNGAAFVAKRDAPGPCPGDGWQMLSMQGKSGKPGPKGDRGERGLAVTASVSMMRVADDGMLTLVNADGSEVKCDLYPILSKIGG